MNQPTCPRCPQHRPVLKPGFWCTPCNEAWLIQKGVLTINRNGRNKRLSWEQRREREDITGIWR